MLFNQGIFWIFFVCFLIIYYVIPSKYRNVMLLMGNIAYAFLQNLVSGVVLITVCIMAFYGALCIERSNNKSTAKKLAIFEIVAFLLILLGFKYLFFIADTMRILTSKGLNDALNARLGDIIVPLGISFYTLRAIGYIADVYKGQKAFENGITFFSVLSFFPLLPSGPIERESVLYAEISKEKIFDWNNICNGLQLFGIGLFMKTVIADRLAIVVNTVYGDFESYSGVVCLIAVFMYSMQIYCDFGGYSYMAIGISKMLDIKVMDNFARPYLSCGIKDFWRRWHISLSSWLRDYVYIPIGGNKKGQFRRSINVLITFLVSGFWHGASWNYVLWGGLHGLFQVCEDLIGHTFTLSQRKTWVKIVRCIITFFLVSFAWIFFRFSDVSEAGRFIKHIFFDFDIYSLAEGALWEAGWGRLQIVGIMFACVVLLLVEVLNERKIISMDWLNEKAIYILDG